MSKRSLVGMKPLSERDENVSTGIRETFSGILPVGMKPLSERDENSMMYNNTQNRTIT